MIFIKKFLLPLICLMWVANVLGQSNPEIDKLNNEADSKLNQSPKEALELATQAAALSDKVKYEKGKAYATALMGVANYKIDNYEEAGAQISESIILATKARDTSVLAFSKYWYGNLELNLGQYAQALDNYENAYQLAKAVNDKRNIARALDGKASLYEAQKQLDKALDYYQQSEAIAREAGFKEWYPPVTFAIANVYYQQGKLELAIKEFNKSMELSDAVKNTNNKALCNQQLATIYYEQRDSKKAFEYIQRAMDLFQETGSTSSFSRSRILMSYIMLLDKQWDLAIGLANESLEAGRQSGETDLQKNAAEALYNIYNYKGDKAKALQYHVLFHELSETNTSQELVKKMAQLELQAKFDREQAIAATKQKAKEAELKAQIEQQRLIKKASLIGLGLLGIIASLAIFAFVQKQKDNRIIAAEKKKSDELLLNILPAEVAQELKDNGKAKAKNYEKATVLFADIKNFTGAAERLTPEQLVNEIDYYFKTFDEIIGKYKIEKIKTIGDAYLCVGGLPIADEDNAYYVVSAALEIQEFMLKAKEEKIKNGQIYFEIRIGINTGPLIAGIVGLRKFAYDIWGDTVNIAARMEQHGEEGKINISGSTYEMIKDKFHCTYRGKIEAKNKGQIDMYFVEYPI